jgi:hypothetical protein
MRKYSIICAAAATVLVAGVTTGAVYFAGSHAHATPATATTIQPLTMHVGGLSVQQISDFSLVFSE